MSAKRAMLSAAVVADEHTQIRRHPTWLRGPAVGARAVFRKCKKFLEQLDGGGVVFRERVAPLSAQVLL